MVRYPKTNSMGMFSMQLCLALKLTRQDKIEIEVAIFKLQWTFLTKFDIKFLENTWEFNISPQSQVKLRRKRRVNIANVYAN